MTIALLGLKVKVRGQDQTSQIMIKVETRRLAGPRSSIEDNFLVVHTNDQQNFLVTPSPAPWNRDLVTPPAGRQDGGARW